MEKTVDYYMSLPYTIELELDSFGYHASIQELPQCTVTVNASENVGELWRLLEENQRNWITNRIERGLEVPEPLGATADPFWKEFPDKYDQHDVRRMLYESGVEIFPLRVLEKLWLGELIEVGLREVEPSAGAPPKSQAPHGDQSSSTPEGDVRLVRLGQSRKNAWIKFDGPRTERGYRDIEVFDQPLRTEAGIVAALITLEASRIEDFDFECLHKKLLQYIKTQPELRRADLQAILEKLPRALLSAWKTEIDRDLKVLDKKLKDLNRKGGEGKLTPAEKKERKRLQDYLPKRSERWERSTPLWTHSITYMLSLFRYRRPDFDEYSLEQQLDLVDNHRKHINKVLEANRQHMAFLEYGTPAGNPRRAVELAQKQIRAAVLKDVEDLSQQQIAEILAVEYDEDRYKVDMKIPKVASLVREGRTRLDQALISEGGWNNRAEEMKAEGDRYNSLSEEEREVEQLAENTGWPIEQAQAFRKGSPGAAQFLAMMSPPH